MTFRNIEFLVQEAFAGIWRNGVMAIASLSTIALSFSVLGAFLLLMLGTSSFIQRELDKFEIGVFIGLKVPRADALALGKGIRQIRGVREVTFIPKEDAWPDFKKERAGKLELGGVESNPLPDAYRVKVRMVLKMVESTARKLRTMDGVESVKEGKALLQRVLAVARFIRYIGAIASLALFATCVFIVSNAIRLTVFARRREIRIMQLVGATDGFIRTPLVIEGTVLGAVGASVSVGLIKLGGAYVAGVVERMMPLLSKIPSGVDGGQFALGLICAGALVGALGSLISIRKFL